MALLLRRGYRLFTYSSCYKRTSALFSRKRVFLNDLRFLSTRKFSSDVDKKPSSISWIDNSEYIADWMKPYLHLARVDKQVGTVLLMWPCIWGVALATPAGGLPDILLMSKFVVGSFVMRGAGCTINDIWDRDIDKHVERTKNRPLASGKLTVIQALQFLALQLSTGLGILLTFNYDTILLGMASMPIVVVYPLMKRYSNWPQATLGLAFNWGVLVGWSSVIGTVDTSLLYAVPLYASGVCWTLVYDTIYGFQDKNDDKKLGLKSVAITLGDRPQMALSAIAGGMLLGLVTVGELQQLHWPYYAGIAGVASHLGWQIWTADITDSKNLWDRFSSNQYTGGLVALAIVLGKL